MSVVLPLNIQYKKIRFDQMYFIKFNFLQYFGNLKYNSSLPVALAKVRKMIDHTEVLGNRTQLILYLFVAASHQTGLDKRSKARRPMKVGIKRRGRSGTSRDSNPAGLCYSSAH